MRKLLLTALVAGPIAILPGSLWALPANQTALDAVVNSKTSGVTITSIAPTLVNVNATANNSVITWTEFGGATNTINVGDTVNFALPSASSAILNRVIGTSGAAPAISTINGTLSSNGKLFIVNPSGVVVGATGVISAPAVTVSSVNEPDGYFLANGNLSFVGTATNAVQVLAGAQIKTVDGAGNIALAGKGVDVAGTFQGNLIVNSQGGNVQMAADGALTVGQAPLVNTVTPIGGDITVTTVGGNVDLAKAGNVTAYGNIVVNTTGGSSNGNIVQTGTQAADTTTYTTLSTKAFPYLVSADQLVGTSVNAASKGITLVTGGNGLTAGNISVTRADTNYLTFTGGAVSYVDIDDVQIKNSSATGSLYLASYDLNPARPSTVNGTTPWIHTGGNISMYTDGSKDADGNTIYNTIDTSAAVAGSTVTTDMLNGKTATLNMKGAITTGAVNAFTGVVFTTATGKPNAGAGGLNLTTDGNITIGSAIDIPSLTLKTTGGNIAQAVGANITNSLAAGAALSVTANGAASTIVLSEATNDFMTASINGAAAGATIGTSGGIKLSGTVVGALTVTANQAFSTPTLPYTVTVPATVAINGSYNGQVTGINLPSLYTPIGGALPTVTITNTAVATAAGGLTAATAPTFTVNPLTGQVTVTYARSGAGYAVFNRTGAAVVGNAPGLVLNANVYDTAWIEAPIVTVTNVIEPVTLGGLKASNGLTINAGVAPVVDSAANYIYGATTINTQGMQVMLTNAGNEFGQININTTNDPTDDLADTKTPKYTGVTNAFTAVVPVNGNVSAAGANVYVVEKTTLNAGAINTGKTGTLRLISKEGNIVNSGTLTVGGAMAVGAGTAVAPGDILLTDATNAITGVITIADDVSELFYNQGTVMPAGSPVGNYLANNISVTNTLATTLASINNTLGLGIAGDITIAGTGAVTLTNTIITTGAVIVNTTGAVTIDDAADSSKFSTVSITAGGNVSVVMENNATTLKIKDVNLTETAAGMTASFTSGAGISFTGAYNSNYTGLTTFTSGNKKAMDDATGSVLNIFGMVKFASADALTINNLGHNFGGIIASAGNDKGLTIVENGTMVLYSISCGKSGNLALTSTTGDIITAPVAGLIDPDGVGALLPTDTFVGSWNGVSFGGANLGTDGLGLQTATFTANQGKVEIFETNAAYTAANPLAAGATLVSKSNNMRLNKVVINAKNSSTFFQSGSNLLLGNITVKEGGVAINTSGAAGRTVAQSTGTKVNVYGDTTFRTNNADIVVANSGNRFGGLILAAGTGNIELTENTTINLKSAATTGTLKLTSEAGDIIDTADTTIAALLPATVNAVTATGATTLSAAKGSIVLDLAGNDFSTVTFTSLNDTKIVDSIGNLTMGGGSSVGGALEATVTGAAGNLYDSGPISVVGNTTFVSSSGDIYVLDNNNRFGAIRFSGANVTIIENTSLNLRGGSIATGTVNLTTYGDFLTSGVGGSSFTGAGGLTINATGTIKPSAGSLLVINTFTVNSPSTKDLSLLSLSGNLVNKAPVNLGTGTYIAPAP